MVTTQSLLRATNTQIRAADPSKFSIAVHRCSSSFPNRTLSTSKLQCDTYVHTPISIQCVYMWVVCVLRVSSCVASSTHWDIHTKSKGSSTSLREEDSRKRVYVGFPTGSGRREWTKITMAFWWIPTKFELFFFFCISRVWLDWTLRNVMSQSGEVDAPSNTDTPPVVAEPLLLDTTSHLVRLNDLMSLCLFVIYIYEYFNPLFF